MIHAGSIRIRPLALSFWVLVAFALFGGQAMAQAVIPILPPLPVPLQLPPGLVESLPLDKTSSFFGDALSAIDCADDADLPDGTCGNQFFGGYAMVDSHLIGSIQIQFYPPVGNLAHFEVTNGTLQGDDTVIESPQGFKMPFRNAKVTDSPGMISSGDLDLTTGVAQNVTYNVLYFSTALDSLFNVNPNLTQPTITFPGVRGHAWVRFEQRPDGLLDFTFRGSTFLPLGKDLQGQLIRWPLPLCNAQNHCASIVARGTSLHPDLYLSTKAPDGPECGDNCPDIPFNTIQEFTTFTQSTSFGDDFNLNIPELGGPAEGRANLTGRFQIQFGPRSGDTVSFVIKSMVPEGLLAPLPPSPIAIPGIEPGLVGQNEQLQFPLVTYQQRKLAFLDEPFNIPQGTIDLKTGKVIGEMVYPSFYEQKLIEVLFADNDGRISTDPFYLVALDSFGSGPPTTYALFEKGVNGQTVFRYSGLHERSFATYYWPNPDYVAADAWLAGAGSTLDLFLELQAMHTSDTPQGSLSGSASNVVSGIGDLFSYNYSIPCNPSGAPFSFEYQNNNPGSSGGTFQMTRLAAVRCFNSRSSTLPPGYYDTVAFSGFGTWSQDPANSQLRFATVQISTSPDYPYAGVLVYQNPDSDGNVVLSSADTKPPAKVLP